LTTIRPNVFPQQAPLGGQRDDAKAAAARAFFAAAMGQAQASAAPVAPVEAQTTAPVQRMPAAAPTEAPQRMLRPGSILDIRV
jgi:hypothetical protein